MGEADLAWNQSSSIIKARYSHIVVRFSMFHYRTVIKRARPTLYRLPTLTEKNILLKLFAIKNNLFNHFRLVLRPSHICKHFHPSCLNKHSHENKLVLDKCLHEIKVFSCDVFMRTKCPHAMFSWKQNVCTKWSHEIKISWRLYSLSGKITINCTFELECYPYPNVIIQLHERIK